MVVLIELVDWVLDHPGLALLTALVVGLAAYLVDVMAHPERY